MCTDRFGKGKGCLQTSYVLHPQLVIISSILERYYSVSTLAVSWTSMIYMVTYIPLIFPASWFLQKKVGIKKMQSDKFGQILKPDLLL